MKLLQTLLQTEKCIFTKICLQFIQWNIFFISFQTIYDSGTYEELCQRQSITTECIFGEEEEETDFDDSPSPLVPTHASNPSPIVVPVVAHKNENNIQCKRAKFVRKQSVMQYMQDQQSIDDDPVTSLYTVNKYILFWITHPTR